MRSHSLQQRGAALVSALVLMVAVLIIGFSAVHAALNDARSARHERDRVVALRAAEAALLDAERELADTPATAPRFAALAGAGFIDGCGKAGSENHGLCMRTAPPAWQVIDLAGDDSALVAYGTFTMRALPGAAQQPRYLIERMPLDPAYGRFYRITALGFGPGSGMRVVLQSFYRKAPAQVPLARCQRDASAGAKWPTGRRCTPPSTKPPGAPMQNKRGFTLIEVMVVLVILMILTSLAYPSYARYLTRARRIEGQVALLEALQQQERYFMRNNTYIAFSAASLDPRARQFRAWSGAVAAHSAYEIEGRACPGQEIAGCIEVRATPGTAKVDGRFRDPECGVLTQDSVGRRSADGSAGAACWP